jgi:hypothetical protein
MLSIAHTLISLPLAFWLERPILIFCATVALHFLADTLLHWNIYPDRHRTYPVLAVAADVIGGVVLAWLLLGDTFFSLPVLAAIAGGNAPDILHGLWDLLPTARQKKFPRWLQSSYQWHDAIQVETTNIPAGLTLQVIVVAAAWIALA